jgi:anti-sigma B factor antagonist
MSGAELLSNSAALEGVAVATRDEKDNVVWLSGEYDLSTATELGHTLARAMIRKEGELVIDLSEVQFLDASTMRAFIRADGALRTQSRSLSLRSPSAFARRILDLCGLAGLVSPPSH